MELVIGLPRTRRKIEPIWVIMDTLMKSFYFIHVKSTFLAEEYARLYFNEIMSLHGSL